MSQPNASWVENVWYGSSRLVWLLLPLSWLYTFLHMVRTFLYRNKVLRSQQVTVPVVVVGNITVGGTGKTPLTVWLADELMARNFSPAIVTRGYRGKVGPHPVVATAASDPGIVGDEAILLASRCTCPVVVHPDRVLAAEKAIALGADIIIADDGLQHLRLARDFEIVVIDGARGFGNGYLLPAGPLREPVSRLESVDEILLQAVAGQHSDFDLQEIVGRARRFQLRARNVVRLDDLASRSLDDFPAKSVHAIAGIGNPQRFFDLLEAHGLDVQRHPLPDHAAIGRYDLQFADDLPLVMTEKDAVKCRTLAGANRWYVPVDVALDESDREQLMHGLLEKIGHRPAKRS
jgi:tetraacyldisaccharide 4'-kinase